MFSTSMSPQVTTLGTGTDSKGASIIGAFSLILCEDGHSLGYPNVGGSLGFPNAGPFLGGSDGEASLL